MDMVEKVRAALLAEMRKGVTNCVSDYREEGGGDEIFIDGHIDGRALARAAIEAMRWPTPEMVKAGAEEFKIMNVEAFTQDVWDAMIDAALKASPASE